MARTDFIDGVVLTAADMNALGEDINAKLGASDVVNIPVSGATGDVLTRTGAGKDDVQWKPTDAVKGVTVGSTAYAPDGFGNITIPDEDIGKGVSKRAASAFAFQQNGMASVVVQASPLSEIVITPSENTTITHNAEAYTAEAGIPLRVIAQGGGEAISAASGTMDIAYNRDSMDVVRQLAIPTTSTGAIATLDGLFGGLPIATDLTLRTRFTGPGDGPTPDAPWAMERYEKVRVTGCGGNVFDLNALAAKPQMAIDGSKVTITNKYDFDTEYNWSAHLVPGQTYTLSRKWSGTVQGVTGRISMLDYATGSQFVLIDRDQNARTFAAPADIDRYKGIRMYGNGNSAIVYDEIMLAPGSAATPYQPYTGQTIEITPSAPLGGMEGCEDMVDRGGVVTRRMRRRVFDGTEAWTLSQSGTDTTRFSLPAPDAVSADTGVIGLSTHVPFITSGISQDRIGVQVSARNILYRMPNSIATTVSELKAWLAAQYVQTPVMIEYPLATPTTERLPMPMLTATDGTNHVYMDADGEILATGYMSGKGVAEILASIQTQITALQTG